MSGVCEKPPISNTEILKLIKPKEAATHKFILQQINFRIKDPKKTVPFYTNVMGMTLLQKVDFMGLNFSLYFFGYEDADIIPYEMGSKARSEWVLSRPACLELVHNWGTEKQPDFKYDNDNQIPRGWGHIGVMVPDFLKACERFDELGVKFYKRPEDGTFRTIAYIQDPDGYSIEIFTNRVPDDY